MGAYSFHNFVKRKSRPSGWSKRMERGIQHLEQTYDNWPNAQEAFEHAKSNAVWEHGHGGYTGTIAEKYDFRMIATVNTEEEADNIAADLFEKGDPRIEDKRGPAGCIEVRGDEGGWLFFGYARS